MTDRDNIELPPLPGEYYQFSKGKTLDYARAAVLCWTDDGRAWIESEDANRHAANLRIMSANKKDYSEFAVCRAAADALDGGVR